MIAAVVLAAGQSRRMGRDNKLLCQVAGKPMILYAVEAALASEARPVIVVLGAEAPEVRAALSGRPVDFVENPAFAEGLSTSLRTGLAALVNPEIEGALICLGDMPRVTAGHLNRLIAAFKPAGGRAICVPTSGGKPGNPILWAASFFPEMKALTGDIGAKPLLAVHRDVVCEVAFEDDAVQTDVDTPDALAALRDGCP